MMEVEKISNNIVTNNYYNDDDVVALPGFRFHPTDEELVGFYLRRKVEKKSIGLEIIKQIDIYKYDPWDLPKSNNGEKEWYYYCKRGRKYKNSVRPNRVTSGSGFWKATGIDKPIYSSNTINDRKCIIGLKKSLVYYKGSAGKGTKTDWQMHEFRLPPHNQNSSEAETWTLCRILKRNVLYRKSILDCKVAAKKQRNDPLVNVDALSFKKCSNNNIDSSSNNNNSQIYISFSTTPIVQQNTYTTIIAENKQQCVGQQSSGTSSQSTTVAAASNSSTPMDFNEWLEHGNWDELKSVFELPFDPLY